MTRILHFADLHLDTSFSSLTASGNRLNPRQELREALRRIVELALQRRVDALTIGGDLYEQDRWTRDTAAFIRSQFERLGDIPVIIAPGNHDPWLPDSLYRQVDWPDNVFVFSEEELRPYHLKDGITLWGAGHRSRALYNSLLGTVQLPAVGKHILLLHGSDTGNMPVGKSAHCPLSEREVKVAGFSLALLGHFHRRTEPAPGVILHYPGSPEPLGFDEIGPHSVILLTLDGEHQDVELIESNHMRYAVLEVDVSGADTRERIYEQVLAEAGRRGIAGAFLRLRLVGTQLASLDLDLEDLAAALDSKFASIAIKDETLPPYDLSLLAEEPTTRGAFVRRTVERLETAGAEERAMLEEALILGLRAFEGRELRPR